MSENDDNEDLGCFPMPAESAVLTSTPKKVSQCQSAAGKHGLTPNSKRQNEPPSKRTMQCRSPLSTTCKFFMKYSHITGIF